MQPEKEYLECCLRDCGFGEQAAGEYMLYAGKNGTAEQLRLLNRQRRKLMEHLHQAQRQVDTVDFLIRSLEERREGEQNCRPLPDRQPEVD